MTSVPEIKKRDDVKARLGVSPLGLSRREAEVLNHVAEGKTNREISMVLGISERTVEKHLENIYKKLGVETRTAAMILFYNNKETLV